MARDLAYVENVGGGTRCYIDDINNKYSIELVLPFNVADRTDGNIAIYDNGEEYDYVRSKFRLFTTADKASDLTTFFEDIGRNELITFFAPASWGMYPFGFTFPLGTSFESRIEKFVNKGQVAKPYLYHSFEITLVMNDFTEEVNPSLGSCTEPGTLTIDGIPNVRFPKNMFKPKVSYAYYTSTTRGGEVYQINRGEDADAFETSFTAYTSEDVAGQLLYQLRTSARATSFEFVVPANSYPFGYESGDDQGFTCKLSQTSIRMTHNLFKDVDIGFKFRKVT